MFCVQLDEDSASAGVSQYGYAPGRQKPESLLAIVALSIVKQGLGTW